MRTKERYEVGYLIPESDLRHKSARFGDYELDCNSGRLVTNGQPVNLEPLVFQFLLLLIQHEGNVLPKQTVLNKLWENKTPTDEAVRAMVKKAREVLKDNARSPTYIKTIPTKGYMLIPSVELRSTIAKTWVQNNRKKLNITGLLVTLVAIVAYFVLTYQVPPEKTSVKVDVKVSELNQINRENVSAYYINDELNYISIELDPSGVYSHVITSNIETKEQTIVTIKGLLSTDFLWSAGSQTIMVTRSDLTGFVGIEYSANLRNPSVLEYDYMLPDNYTILGLTSQEVELYILDLQTDKIDIVSLVTKEIRPFIPSLNLLLDINLEDTPRFKLKDIAIWPSPQNGHVVLSISTDQSISLFAISNNEVSSEDPLNITRFVETEGYVQSAVWDQKGHRFSFSNNDGALFSYQLAASRLTSWNMGGKDINTLVADCGETCFIVSETQGLPKLTEMPNPFLALDALAFASFINTKSRTESLPLYTEQGLYFLSETSSALTLIFRDKAFTETQIYRFDKRSQIDEITVNSDGDTVVGLLNQRPFILDVDSKQFSFLPIAFPELSHFSFNLYGNIEFYAKPSNGVSGLYEYDLQTKQVVIKQANVIMQRPLVLIEKSEKGQVRHRANLIIEERSPAKIVFQSNKGAVLLPLLTNNCSACFHIHENVVYHIEMGQPHSLLRTNLLTGETTKQTFLISDLIEGFALSPNGESLVLVSRQELQTNLSKIEGMLQVY